MAFFDSTLKDKFLGKNKFFQPDFILKQIKARKGLTQDLYERSLNGLEYLSQLRDIGLDPIFKGGSAVQLLIPENLQRLSIDIDLTTDLTEKEITSILNIIHEKFNKKIYNFDRVGKNLPSHLVLYNIYIPSLFSETSSKIELDFLLHKPNFKIQQTPIKTFLYESNYSIKTPTINALIGDKLTVLGPKTIGKEMKDKPLNFAKQLYDISILLSYSSNIDEIFNAYLDVFNFEKKIRNLPNLNLKDVINDLTNICKLFSLIHHIPYWINDIEIMKQTDFLKRGINGLLLYTSNQLKLSTLKVRTNSAKIAFLGKLLLLKHKDILTKPIPMEIFQEGNLKIKKMSQDLNIINEIIEKLKIVNRKERFHLHFKEIKKIDPVGLIFWFGYYFPMDLIQMVS